MTSVTEETIGARSDARSIENNADLKEMLAVWSMHARLAQNHPDYASHFLAPRRQSLAPALEAVTALLSYFVDRRICSRKTKKTAADALCQVLRVFVRLANVLTEDGTGKMLMEALLRVDEFLNRETKSLRLKP